MQTQGIQARDYDMVCLTGQSVVPAGTHLTRYEMPEYTASWTQRLLSATVEHCMTAKLTQRLLLVGATDRQEDLQ